MDAIDFVKTFSNVPNEFIDDFFSFYKDSTLQTDFVIDARKVAKWLEISLPELIKTLKKLIVYTLKN